MKQCDKSVLYAFVAMIEIVPNLHSVDHDYNTSKLLASTVVYHMISERLIVIA